MVLKFKHDQITKTLKKIVNALVVLKTTERSVDG